MTKTSARRALPHEGRALYLTDGGIETTLIFHDGFELPEFSAVTLMETPEGRAGLKSYFERYLPIAREAGLGFVLESPTWRASPDWVGKIGLDLEGIERANRAAMALMAELRESYETERSPIVISGCVGPRGDGYDPGAVMTPEEAERYHAWQIGVLKDAGAELITAITMTNIPEAIGLARAAGKAGVPVVISFTVETDGRLPAGDLLKDAIEAVDAACEVKPAYYMINCAHPTHIDQVLEQGAAWTDRIGGLRANASKCSHAELNEAEELDTGNPSELGREHAELVAKFPAIRVLGGCCGTDHRHIAAISEACAETV
ncbi:MAG: homocysteine S-methyltransferase family protein [Maricaulaceae bacterium]|jgi:S-methylmethionine-dependent homocysteine/selenocysteine methylase